MVELGTHPKNMEWSVGMCYMIYRTGKYIYLITFASFSWVVIMHAN
jgi:hypothetical protein